MHAGSRRSNAQVREHLTTDVPYHPFSNLPCSQVECLHSGPSLDPSSILYPEQPHCRLQSACRRGSEASVTASVHLTTGVPYHPSSLPPTHWQPRIIRQSGFPNAKLLVSIGGAQTSRFGCMQPVRYAEGSAPVNCLAAGVCSEKGQGEPGLVEAERGFSMAIGEGWNQWAATIYILNQWQFAAGK